MRKILTTVILCLAAQLVHAQSNYDVSDWAEFDSKAHGHSGETNPAPQLTDGDLITLKGNITFGHNVRISQNDCSGGSDLFTYPTGITINGDNNNYDLDLNGYSLQGNDTLNLNNLNVENGTVMIGDSTAAGAPGGTITLTNTDWDNATISGAGNVVIGNDTAPSTTTFNGVNTYTGTTTIGGLATMNVNASGALNSTQSVTVKGTLNTYSTTQTIQSLAGNVNGRLNNDGDLTVRAGTWQGIINGVGSLNVDGNFTIGGNQSQNYTGATTVSSGTLRLNVANAIVNSSGVSVSSGATLSAIHGANVKSVTLQSGAVLQVELDPTSAALNTETVVRVGSGASLVADLGGQPLGRQQVRYTLFKADQEFDRNDISFVNASGRVRFDQLLDGYLYLLLSGGLYGDFAPQLRPNARPITHVIDAYQAAGGSSPLTDALDALGYSQVPGAFNQLPGNVFAMGRVAVVDLRKNFNGLLPTFQNTFDEYVPPLTSSYRGQSPEVGSGKCGVGSGYASHRCEYWATPTGRWIDRSSQGGYYGYGLGNAGVALGVSRRINRNHHIGLAVGYDYANLDMHDISQKDEFHAVNAALYGGYVDRCQFLDWQVGYGKNFHNTERTVAFNGFYAKPTADYDDDVFALGLMYGRRCGAFLPSVGLELVQVWTPMFVEDGVSGAELRGERSDYTSVELPIGFRLRAAFCERGVSGSHSSPRVRSTRLVEPELRAFWVPQLGDQSSRIGTAFAGGGGEFLVDSGDFGWQHVRLGSGLTARFSRCWSGSINYDAALYSGTTRQTASVALTARF